MIARKGMFFVPKCDICGLELSEEKSYWDAIDARTDAKWTRKRTRERWIDVCRVCSLAMTHFNEIKEAAK